MDFPLLDSFQNNLYGRSDRCTGDCFKAERWTREVFRTLSVLFLSLSERVQVKAL